MGQKAERHDPRQTYAKARSGPPQVQKVPQAVGGRPHVAKCAAEGAHRPQQSRDGEDERPTQQIPRR